MLAGRLVRLRGRAIRLSSWQASQFHSSSIALRKVLRTFKLADIGEGITECEVIRWCVIHCLSPRTGLNSRRVVHRSVKPSATVQSFDTLCEVQSDKASVEITSPFDGVVKDILVKEGDVAKVGEGLCTIEVEDDGQPEENAAPADPPPHPQQEAVKTPGFAQEKVGVAQHASPAPRKHHPLDPNAPSDTKAKSQDRKSVV